jgi:hypothetical protein
MSEEMSHFPSLWCQCRLLVLCFQSAGSRSIDRLLSVQLHYRSRSDRCLFSCITKFETGLSGFRWFSLKKATAESFAMALSKLSLDCQIAAGHFLIISTLTLSLGEKQCRD